MKYLEPTIWLSALVVLYFLEPSAGPSLCLFKAVGLESCPGCGIGHAIHYALHGQWRSSLDAHWMGIPATVFIFLSIVKPFIQTINHHTTKDGSATAYDVTGTSAR